MATATFDEDKLKDLLKAAVVEVLEERRDLVLNIVKEAIEDVALSCAIEQGLSSDSVSRREVFERS